MKVHVLMRGNGRAIKRGRLIVTDAKGGHDFLVNLGPDRLHNAGGDNVTLGVDSDLNDYVADQAAWKIGTIDLRLGKDRQCDVDLMTGDRAVDDLAEGRTGLGVDVALIGAGIELMLLPGGFRLFGLRRMQTRLLWSRSP